MHPAAEQKIHPELSIVTSAPAWDALETAWRELSGQQADASPFNSWEWMRTWWEVYGGAPMSLRILVWRLDGKVVGIAPLVICAESRWPLRPRRLRVVRLVGTGEPVADTVLTEYGDLLATPGHEEMIAAACTAWLCGPGAKQWDALAFDYALEGSIVERWLMPALQGRGRTQRRRPAALRYRIRLPSTWEDYHARLGPRFRAGFMVGRRRMERDGRLEIETIGSPERMPEALERLAVLHQRRWTTKGHVGAFDSSRFRDFHLRLATAFATHGAASVRFLRLDDCDLAATYSLRSNDSTFLYQTGFDPARAANYSPGTVLLGLEIEAAIHAGHSGYDLMGGGSDSYKAHYGGETTPMVHLYGFNRTVRGRLALALWNLRERSGRLRSLLRSRRRAAAVGTPGVIPEEMVGTASAWG